MHVHTAEVASTLGPTNKVSNSIFKCVDKIHRIFKSETTYKYAICNNNKLTIKQNENNAGSKWHDKTDIRRMWY